jgi:hypothetical protein
MLSFTKCTLAALAETAATDSISTAETVTRTLAERFVDLLIRGTL